MTPQPKPAAQRARKWAHCNTPEHFIRDDWIKRHATAADFNFVIRRAYLAGYRSARRSGKKGRKR